MSGKYRAGLKANDGQEKKSDAAGEHFVLADGPDLPVVESSPGDGSSLQKLPRDGDRGHAVKQLERLGNGDCRESSANASGGTHTQDASMKTAVQEDERRVKSDSQSRPQESIDDIPTATHDQGDLLVLNRFILYETKTRFYAVASNQSEAGYRILKIDRTSATELVLVEDPATYDEKELAEMMSMIDEGNKATGGLRRTINSYGIIGFIKFTGPYYICLITKRSVVALVGWNYIYHVDETALIPINASAVPRSERSEDEQRYVTTFQSVDLSKNFYFSYTWDLTNTLQKNMLRDPSQGPLLRNDMFVWNHHLIRDINSSSAKEPNSAEAGSGWIIPLIHGYVDQSKLSVLGRTVYLTLIGRRSRHFAGARFLKRGVNDRGYVANDVETEQIVAEMLTTPLRPFDSANPDLLAKGDSLGGNQAGEDWRSRRWPLNPRFTSYVQHRGSIPLFWSQDTTSMSPKPPIELTVIDPFYSAAALHFDNMFQRYGSPVIVLNLIKAKEKHARESKLLVEFTSCIDYLNQSLPEDHRLRYIAWDMSRAARSPDEDVIGVLEDIAQECLAVTKFFHSGRNEMGQGEEAPLQQDGIVRTNCIDCLDRTNAAQFILAKCALAHQLHALGILDEPRLAFDTDAVNILTEMTHDLGDTIALQYGGSHLVNTMETYRKIGAWTSHSRDMIENLRRYYSNSFIDAEKQDAINLFLGNYLIDKKNPKLWELTSDFYLHNIDPRFERMHRDYIHWYTDEHLIKHPVHISGLRRPRKRIFRDRYWSEYYRPLLLTSFTRHFAFTMNSTSKYQSYKHDKEVSPLSPFYVKKGLDTSEAISDRTKKRWLLPLTETSAPNMPRLQSRMEPSSRPNVAANSTLAVLQHILPPTITEAETEEYHRYVNQFSEPTFVSSSSDANQSAVISHADLTKFALQSGFLAGSVLPIVANSDAALYESVASLQGVGAMAFPTVGKDRSKARRKPDSSRDSASQSTSVHRDAEIQTLGPKVVLSEPEHYGAVGRNILLLRALDTENQDVYHATFEEAGFCPCSIPVLSHELCDRLALASLLRQPEKYSGLILTSGRAIEAVRMVLEARHPAYQKWATMPIYVVGSSSRAKALDLDFGRAEPQILGHDTGSSERLAHYIVRHHRATRPLLYLVGDKRRDTLTKILGGADVGLKEFQVYRTVPSRHFSADLEAYLDLLGLENDLHWAVFFSPSGADVALPYLRDLKQKSGRVRLACIGPTTSEHLTKAGLEADAVADKPDPLHLLEAIESHVSR